MLLHPFALCAQVWKPIVPALSRHHAVRALAMPGHHGSDPLPSGYRHCVADAADVLEAKLDALGIAQAHMVGNSLGGWLALELARRGRALSATAFAPGGGWEPGSAEQRRLMRRFRATRKLLMVGGPIATRLTGFSLARRCLLRDAVARPERMSPAQARLLIERIWRCAVYDDVLAAMPSESLVWPTYASIACPVRVVWGERDRVLPLRGYSERWRRTLPSHTEWIVLPNVGHLPMYDDPDAVARCVLALTTRASQSERLAS